MTAMLFTSGLLLLYTALVVPIQMLLWDYSNPCIMFPTLYLDILVDSFFLVAILSIHLFEKSIKMEHNLAATFVLTAVLFMAAVRNHDSIFHWIL
jgi:hypothetical protein